MAQEVPFHRSANALVAVPALLTNEPTAVQAVDDEQETAARVASRGCAALGEAPAAVAAVVSGPSTAIEIATAAVVQKLGRKRRVGPTAPVAERIPRPPCSDSNP